jgi:hypothetical protein
MHLWHCGGTSVYGAQEICLSESHRLAADYTPINVHMRATSVFLGIIAFSASVGVSELDYMGALQG